MELKKWYGKYKLHLLVWGIYILYETVVVGLFFGIYGHPITYIAHYIIIFVLFYAHADLFFPWAQNSTNKIWRILFIILIEILGFVLASFLVDRTLINYHVIIAKDTLELNFQYLLKVTYRVIPFIGFATGYYYLITAIKEKRKTNELEKQHLNDIINQQKAEQELTKAHNAFLKAQINPHFLFNTLDFIYHSIADSSPIAADAVIVLTEMMRYAVDADKMGEYIYLGEEIEQAENLIYLNQVRKNHSLYFKLNYAEEIKKIRLIPLVLLTLVENIFKHGNLGELRDEAIIDIYQDEHYLHIKTCNLISQSAPGTSSHAGLKNIEKRLSFSYGPEVIFNYHNDATDHFYLQLSIPLSRLSANVA